MKTSVVACLALVVAPTAALATPKEDLQKAIAKLADAPNYSWTATTESAGGGGGRFGSGPVSGMAEKGGCAVITRETPNGPSQTVAKGEQRVIQTPEGWVTADEMRQRAQAGGGGGGGPGRGGFAGMMAMGLTVPVDELTRAAGAIGEFTSADGAITGELSGDLLSQTLRGGGRGGPGGAAAAPTGSGTIKVWLTDGMPSKYQVHVTGSITGRDGQPRNIDRTVTTEIKDVGTTNVVVPPDALAKLGG